MPDNEIILVFITFFTAIITSLFTLGGMILVAVIPSFLPAMAIIPIHGITQLFTNISQAFLSYKEIQFKVFPLFISGSIVGTLTMSYLISKISFEYIPLFIGTYILLSIWSDKFNEKIKRFDSYFIIGFIQTGLSIVVGATGPLTMVLLLKEYEDKEKVVATQAALMSITHLFKIILYIYLGFAFMDYLNLIISILIASILGSYIATKIRRKINQKSFKKILKILLSLLAIKVIVFVFIQ